jgi:hypothetical protein
MVTFHFLACDSSTTNLYQNPQSLNNFVSHEKRGPKDKMAHTGSRRGLGLSLARSVKENGGHASSGRIDALFWNSAEEYLKAVFLKKIVPMEARAEEKISAIRQPSPSPPFLIL